MSLQGAMTRKKASNNPGFSKSPVDKPSPRFPKRGPYGKRCPSSEPFPHTPAREPSLQVPFTELPQRETPHLQSPFQPYLKVHDRQAHSRLPSYDPIKWDAHSQSLPFITFGTPSKGALPPVSPNRAPIEKDALSPETPYDNISEFPVNGHP